MEREQRILHMELPGTEIRHHRERGVFAARYRELGLTAYGNTEAEAEFKLDEVVRLFVTKLPPKELERRLKQAGIRFYWESETTDAWEPVSTTVRPPKPLAIPV